MGRPRKEKIIQAAIRKDGIVYTMPPPARHNNILHLCEELTTSGLVMARGDQGFVTNTGRFVDRIEAASIAIAAKQIEELKWPPSLYSEDLW
jgi:hypothetical protein